MLLFLDVLYNLGHVVLVLAKLGGILQEFLVLLFRFRFLERNRFLFFLLCGVSLLGLAIGVEFVGADELDPDRETEEADAAEEEEEEAVPLEEAEAEEEDEELLEDASELGEDEDDMAEVIENVEEEEH